MRRAFCYSLCAISLGVLLVLSVGCDGGGLIFKVTPPDAGDRPGGWDPGDWDPGIWDPGGLDPGGSAPQDSRFTGQWVASFGDDRATGNARFGPVQYAMSLNMRQSGSNLSGNGILFRVFREGPTASNRITVQVSGTASGDDATFMVRSSGLDRDQLWHVRLAGNRMAGMYVARGDAGEVVRSGHTIWHKAIMRAYENIPWAASYSDDFGFTGFPRRSRTASITPVLGQSGVGGSGTFYEHRGLPSEIDFDIVRGGVSGAELGLTFGGVDLIDKEVDWFGFFGGNFIKAAYGQFDASDALIRFGHATWVRAPVRELTAINGTWTGSFRDQTVETPSQPADFVAVFNLTVTSGGEVTGYALIRNEADDAPDFLRYNIDEGSITGTRAQISMSRVASSFFWDLRLGDGVLLGSYQRFVGAQNRFTGTGHAEFRRLTSPGTLRGTWAAAYMDTFGAVSPEQTQLALVTVSNQPEAGGPFNGFGALRFAGENRRRLFNVTGDVVAGDIVWQWRGADLFGDTIWHLRRAGNLLYGTYTNYTAGGAIESRGAGVWVQSSFSGAFEQ